MENQRNETAKWQELATYSDHELSQKHFWWVWGYRLGIAGSFTAMAMFIVERMAGTNANILAWTGYQYLNGGIALLFAFIFSAFIYGFYLSGPKAKARIWVFAVAAAFPLFSEVSQTMNRSDEMTASRSQASPEFIQQQKLSDSLIGAAKAPVNSAEIAAAEGDRAEHAEKLKACAHYPALSRVGKCQRYEQAKVAAADGRIAGLSRVAATTTSTNQKGAQESVATLGALGDNIEHAHQMIKLFVSVAGVSGLVANLIMALIVIGSIETALAWVGEHVKDYQKAMRTRGLEIGNQRREVVRVSQPPAAPTPDSRTRYSADDIKAAAGNPAPFKVHPVPYSMAGVKGAAAAPVVDLAAYRTSRPASQKPGATGPHNPALGTVEEQHEMPFSPPAPPIPPTVSDTVPARSGTVPATVRARSQDGLGGTVLDGLTGDARQVETDLYPAWAGKVRGGEITPGARDCKRFISQSTKSKDDRTGLTVQEMGRIWLVWNGRALSTGILKPNPDYSNGKAKYVLA